MARSDEGNQPIANVEAEAALLGGLMIENRSIDAVADRLNPVDFFEPLHGRIYSAILSQHALGKLATSVTLRPFFDADADMKEVGGPAYLAQLTGSMAAVIGVLEFADQVKELAQRRRVIAGFRDAIDDAADLDRELEDVLADADGLLTSLGDADASTEVTAAEAVHSVMKQFDEPIHGARCGVIGDADRLMGPLRPKKLAVIGGRPGMGKTAFAISYGLGAARLGHGVLFISLEMGSDELGGRIAADMCHDGGAPIPYEVINESRPTMDQVRRIAAARDRLKTMPFRIIDRGSLTPSQLDVIIRRYRRRFAAAGRSLDLVIVDYLQLMRPDQKMGSSYDNVSEISKRLKAAAKSHGVAVMALAQLSRKVEERQDRRPYLSDLKESGQIEQDADIVLLLYRAAHYAELLQPDPKSPEFAEWSAKYQDIKDRIELILGKRRDGRRGSALAYYFTEYQALRGSNFYEEAGR